MDFSDIIEAAHDHVQQRRKRLGLVPWDFSKPRMTLVERMAYNAKDEEDRRVQRENGVYAVRDVLRELGRVRKYAKRKKKDQAGCGDVRHGENVQPGALPKSRKYNKHYQAAVSALNSSRSNTLESSERSVLAVRH